MAAFGAERKLLFEVNCFRFCPTAAIAQSQSPDLSRWKADPLGRRPLVQLLTPKRTSPDRFRCDAQHSSHATLW